MTRTTIPVGVGAGLAAMLLMAALLTQTAVAFPLFILSPLPLAVAGFAFGPLAAAIGAVTVTAGVAFAAGPASAVAALVLIAGPTVWITYVLGLSRQRADGTVEWYPYGRALLQASVMVGLGLILVGLVTDFDAERLTAEAVSAMQAWLAGSPTPINRDQIETLMKVYVAVLPYTTAAGALAMLAINGYLGARVAETSGRLKRTREPLWTTQFPPAAAVLFLVAAGLAFLPGTIGDAAGAFAGALGFGFALVGLAALHALTRDSLSRGFILAMAYAFVLLFGLSLILLAVLGIADSLIDLRSRQSRRPTS
ncbi:MAG: hypothetical protein KIS96_01395 [Bauldia sp.]|nr:hypothetical protein [Bauldia sp.]